MCKQIFLTSARRRRHPPLKVPNENSKGEGGFKSPYYFLKESMTLKWNFRRGFKLKNLRGRGMDIFWNNTIVIQLGSLHVSLQSVFNSQSAFYTDLLRDG